MSNDKVQFSPGVVAATLAIAVTLSTAIWTAASTHERISINTSATDRRIAAAEERIKTLEEKIAWQNKRLWEIGVDLRQLVIRAGGTPTTVDER